MAGLRRELIAFAVAAGLWGLGCGPALLPAAQDGGPQLELGGPLAFAPGHAVVVPSYDGQHLQLSLVARDDAGSCLGDGALALTFDLWSTSGQLVPAHYPVGRRDGGLLAVTLAELDGDRQVLQARDGWLQLDGVDTHESTRGAGNHGSFEARFGLPDGGTGALEGQFDLARPECD